MSGKAQSPEIYKAERPKKGMMSDLNLPEVGQLERGGAYRWTLYIRMGAVP